MPTDLDIKGLLTEIDKRENVIDVLADNFPAQDKFISDPSRLKAAICSRRSGKTFGVGIYLFKEALETPNVNCLYIGKTRINARSVMFKKVLPAINRKYSIGAKFNQTTLDITLPNGSTISLMGADSSAAEMEKIRGNAYKLACIDECGAWKVDQKELVYDVLEPAMIDHNGTIVMIGTPGYSLTSLFFKVTNDKEPGWSVHRWTPFDNPFMVKQATKALEDALKRSPNFKKTNTYKREWLAQWCFEDEDKVYRFDENNPKNLVKELPKRELWYKVIGMDNGYNDAFALSIGCYSPGHNVFYIIETVKHSKMLYHGIGDLLGAMIKKHSPVRIVSDPNNKTLVESLKQDYGFPIVVADKQDKRGAVEVMNSDFVTGHVRVLDTPATKPLRDEYDKLVVDPNSDEWKELASCKNDLCDASLYVYRDAKKYLRGTEDEETNKKGDMFDKWIAEQEERYERLANDPNAWLEE